MKSIFGYGLIAKAICSTFRAGTWCIFDDKFSEISKDEFGNLLLPSSEFDPEKSELEIISPAISPSHFLVKNAKNLTSEMDFYFDSLAKSVWISGTNGKTSTSQMCAKLLGTNAIGNIGVALANAPKDDEILVVEMSSFALHYTKVAAPFIYLLLPIEPDHISWHGSFCEYVDAKLSVIFRMNKAATCVLPKEFENRVKAAKCHLYFYENEQDLAKIFGLDLDKIAFKPPFLLDAALALSAAVIASGKRDYEKLNSVILGEHKMQEFRDKKNRLWIDDSKATNISAAVSAVRSCGKKRIHLIVGGQSKGQDMSEFFSLLPKSCKIYNIGSEDFSAFCADFSFVRCDLKGAVEQIFAELKEDEVALLSPACASLDEFSSYKDRGEKFIGYIKECE